VLDDHRGGYLGRNLDGLEWDVSSSTGPRCFGEGTTIRAWSLY